MDVAGLQRQKRETEKQNGHLALQARIIKLEGQVSINCLFDSDLPLSASSINNIRL